MEERASGEREPSARRGRSMRVTFLPWDLGTFLPCLRQANGDRLLRVGDLLAGLAALQLAMLELVHGFLDALLSFLTVTGHRNHLLSVVVDSLSRIYANAMPKQSARPSAAHRRADAAPL